MVLEVKREEKENPRKLIRRFCQKFRQTGIQKKVRAGQFRQRPLSKSKKKLRALRRLEIKKKFEDAAKFEK